MILTRLELNNYKIYYGNQVLNLAVDDSDSSSGQKKNLILIGGLNGRGKTTILNAVYYVLFGQQGMTEEEYKLTFSSGINDRFFDEGGRECSVSLSFKDEKEVITVCVTWVYDHRKTMIHENRKVFVEDPINGEMRESNMTKDEYYDFINRRIPHEVSQFFIFDGEKIQDLVAKQDQKKMKNSIQRIVSIEVYQQLVEDLSLIQSSLERKLGQKKTSKLLDDYLTEIEEYKDKLEKAQHIAKQTKLEIDELEAKHQEVSQERRRLIANNTESNVEIHKRLISYQHTLNDVNKQLETFLESSLAKLLLVPLVKQLKSTLQEEKEYTEKINQASIKFAPYETFMNRLINVETDPPLLREQINKLQEDGKEIWAELNHIRKSEIPHREIIHDVSPGVRKMLMSLPSSVNQNIETLLDQRLKYMKLIKQAEEELANATDPVDTTALDNELKEIGTKLGERKSRYKNAKSVAMKSKDNIENLRRQYTNTQSANATISEAQSEYDLLVKIKQVAKEFVEEATKLKAQKIKYEFTNIMERLVQKEQEFQEIEFSEKDFVVRIYNDRGAEVKLSDRSAGEKQIISLSFIWALTKTAGLKLPFIIDTPLGRLDSVHRNHIIKHYFNLLSDQVIILSTDTEITDDYFKQVEKYMTRSYQLVYDEKLNSTSIKEGYFTN